MRRLALLALLFPVVAESQVRSTRETIERAVTMYEAFEVEGARPLLLQIISPGYTLQVRPEERVQAYKYLGASYALLEKRDSALTFFASAIDIDPFVDLDPEKFSPAELRAFSDAKAQLFKVGAKAIRGKVVNPRADTSAYVFQFITTSRANLSIYLVGRADSILMYEGANDGPRQVRWLGVLPSGAFADTGVYQLRAAAIKSGTQQRETQTQTLRLEHAYEPLEDTIPSFGATDTLATLIPSRAPWNDLLKGVFTGVAAVGIPLLAQLDNDVTPWQTHAAAAAGITIGAGAISFFFRRQNRQITANIQENARRKRQRDEFNAAVRSRNQVRLDARLIIITPVAGVGQ